MYIAFKILHIAAVVIFLGNLVTGIFWKMQAERSRDPTHASVTQWRGSLRLITRVLALIAMVSKA